MADSSRCPHNYAPCPFCSETQDVEILPGLMGQGKTMEIVKLATSQRKIAMSEMLFDLCPNCGELSLIRDEVDIGEGIMYSLPRCENCGWQPESLDVDKCLA